MNDLKNIFEDFESEPDRDIWEGIEMRLTLPLKTKFVDFEAEPEKDVWAGIEIALSPLKTKFADFEAEPEKDVWAGIETALSPLKAKFADFEAEPERNVWAGIETALHPQQAKAIPVWGNTWKPWLVAASVALILATSVVFMQNTGNDAEIKKGDVAIVNPPSQTTEANPTIESENETENANPVEVIQNPNPDVVNVDNKNIKQRTKVYIVKVTENYDASKESSAQNPVVTRVEKQQVQQPVIIAPANFPKEEPQNTVVNNTPKNEKVAEKPQETEEWIVYEMPKKKKEPTKKQTIFPQNTHNEVLNLNSMNFNDVAAFSAQKINKVINTPVKVNQNKGETTYEVKLGGIKIQHKAAKKVEREY